MIERNNSRNKPVDPFRSILENSIGDILPRLLAFYVNLPAEQQCSARLVLFGLSHITRLSLIFTFRARHRVRTHQTSSP